MAFSLSDLEHVVYQPRIDPEPHYPTPLCLQVEVTITVQLELMRHCCLTGQYIELDDRDPLFFQETRCFGLHVLKNPYRAYHSLSYMLRRLPIDPESPTFNACIDDIIGHGLRTAKWTCNRGRKILPLHAEVKGTLVKHVNYSEEEGFLIGRALAESESEFERSNYGMVPAKESSLEKMLKRVRVEDGESEKGGERIKRRRVKGEDCVICLEELKVGSEASRMPCLHTFHEGCIVKWLKQSHYCPVCRFEMPTSETEELSFPHSS